MSFPYPSMEPRARFGYHIKAKLGITLEQYEELFTKADHKCEICSRPVSQAGSGRGRGSMSTGCIDHCHDTGKIRGVLCRICNSFLGVIKEQPDLLTRYLSKP